jgi:hypothetical protein
MDQMILRCFAAASLAAVISLSLAAPAAAIPVKVSYSFSYNPPLISLSNPASSIFSLAAIDPYPPNSTLGGTLQFFSQTQFSTGACGGAITIGPIGAFSSSGGSFLPPDPCFGDPDAELLFSFSGQVTDPNDPSNTPQAYAFPPGTLFAAAPPTDPIDLGSISNGNFGATGPIYGFASPGTEIGSWSINVTAVPEPPTLPLVALGIGFVLLRRLKRRSRS